MGPCSEELLAILHIFKIFDCSLIPLFLTMTFFLYLNLSRKEAVFLLVFLITSIYVT